MTLFWWLVWSLCSQPDISTAHWLSFLILAVAVDIFGVSASASN